MELNRFREIAEHLYSPFKPDDGVPLLEIEQIEKVRNFTFPKVLRDFYLLCGEHEPINYSFNRLIGIDYLEIEAGKLVFYQENQSVCDWAIDQKDLAQDDPPVWQGWWVNYPIEIDWYPEANRLSVFLTSMLCWQSVMGGLPYNASRDQVDASTIKKIEDNFEPIDFGDNYKEMRVFIKSGKILCMFAGENNMTLYTAASDENKFLEMNQLLSIQ